MLLDRGVLVREGNAYRLTGEIETLEVPETLQALIAARLDGLGADERRSVQDASVLGRTFTLRGLSSVSHVDESELEPILASLVRKEVFVVHVGSTVARSAASTASSRTSSRRSRTTRSRERSGRRSISSAAEYLRSLGDDEEIVEVARSALSRRVQRRPERRRRGRRSATRPARCSCAPPSVRRRSPPTRRRSTPTSARSTSQTIRFCRPICTSARESWRRSAHGQRKPAPTSRLRSRSSTTRARRMLQPAWKHGSRRSCGTGAVREEGLERMDRAYQALSQEEPDADLAQLAAQLGRFLFFAGRHDIAMQRIESALELAEGLALPETFSQALNTKAILLVSHGRMLEGLALLRYALEVALENDKPTAALRAYFNLADSLQQCRSLRGGGDDRAGRARVRASHRQPPARAPLPRPELFAVRCSASGAKCWSGLRPSPRTGATRGRPTQPSEASASSSACTPVVSTRLDTGCELLDEFSTSSDAQERAAIAAGKGRAASRAGRSGRSPRLRAGGDRLRQRDGHQSGVREGGARHRVGGGARAPRHRAGRSCSCHSSTRYRPVARRSS